MKWFGESWGAPICETCPQIPVPDGEACPRCHKTIRPGQQGFEITGLAYDLTPLTLAYHRDCFLADLGIKFIGNHGQHIPS